MVDIIITSFLSLVLIVSGIIWIFFQEKYWEYRKKEIRIYNSYKVIGVFQVLLAVLIFYLILNSNT